MQHDQLFKLLLTTFFSDFLELFFPEVRVYADTTSILFLDKEFFKDATTGKKREADIVARLKFRESEAFFIVNVEGQGIPEPTFGERFFFYFAQLRLKHRLPVYPIVVLYGDTPKGEYPANYREAFPDHTVLEFHYRVIQLNRLNWRSFIYHPNPLAAALMAKMKIAPKDRPYAKLECLRAIATLKLDVEKMELLSSFVDTYLNLNQEEEQIFQQELAKIEPRRREKVMELTTSWMRKGIEEGKQIGRREGRREGKHEGKQEGRQEEAVKLILRQLNLRIGNLPSFVKSRIEALPLAQLEKMSEAVLDFSTLAGVTSWLDERTATKKKPRRKAS